VEDRSSGERIRKFVNKYCDSEVYLNTEEYLGERWDDGSVVHVEE